MSKLLIKRRALALFLTLFMVINMVGFAPASGSEISTPSDLSAGGEVQEPTEESTGEPEDTTEAPAEDSTDESATEEPTEESTEAVTDEPAEETTEESTGEPDETTGENTETPTEESTTEQSTEEPTSVASPTDVTDETTGTPEETTEEPTSSPTDVTEEPTEPVTPPVYSPENSAVVGFMELDRFIAPLNADPVHTIEREGVFTKEITADPEYFREYTVTIKFTPESSSLEERPNTNATLGTAQLDGNKVMKLTAEQLAKYKTIETEYNRIYNANQDKYKDKTAIRESLNQRFCESDTGRSNHFIMASSLEFPCYIPWIAIKNLGKENEELVENYLVACNANVCVTDGNVNGNKMTLEGTPNALYMERSNNENLGITITDEKTQDTYMLVRMATFTQAMSNAKNVMTGQKFPYYTSPITTEYNRMRIVGINNYLPTTDFELIPDSVKIDTAPVGYSLTSKDVLTITGKTSYVGEHTLTYRIRPRLAGKFGTLVNNSYIDADSYIDGNPAVPYGNTSFTFCAVSTDGKIEKPQVVGPNATNAKVSFKVPPLFKTQVQIDAKTMELNDGKDLTKPKLAYSIIAAGDESYLIPIITLFGDSTTNTEKMNLYFNSTDPLPEKWKEAYELLLSGGTATYADITKAIMSPESIPDGTLDGYAPSTTIYGFVAYATLWSESYCKGESLMSLFSQPLYSIARLEVIGGKLVIQVVGNGGIWKPNDSENSDDMKYADVKVIKDNNSGTFHVAGEINGPVKVYEGVANAESYTATAYVPYGYKAEYEPVVKKASGEGATYGVTDEHYLIKIKITKENQPFFRDSSAPIQNQTAS